MSFSFSSDFSLLISGGLIDDILEGINSPTEVPQGAQCLPRITINRVPLNATISCVLSRSRVLSCANNISKAFKVLFQIGTAAEEMRRDTSDNVKDLCPAFVNLTSTVVWMGNIRDLTFMPYMFRRHSNNKSS